MKFSEMTLKDQLESHEHSMYNFIKRVSYNQRFIGEKMQFACMISWYLSKLEKTDDSLLVFQDCIDKSFAHDFEMEQLKDGRYVIDTEVARIDAQKYADEIAEAYMKKMEVE